MSTKFRIEDYIQLESWDDIVSRPAYAEEIDPTIEHPVEILAAYTFRDEEITAVFIRVERLSQAFARIYA